jgi:uncharacterized phage-associated protein
MYSALNTANTFITFGKEGGKPVTHMQLQKLLYYAQGWHLALVDAPLFNDEFNKWPFGPVCPTVYDKLKEWKGSPITECIASVESTDSEETKKYLKKIWEMYGHYSGIQLMNLSHSESPWINAENYKCISKNSLKSYFTQKIKSYEAQLHNE